MQVRRMASMASVGHGAPVRGRMITRAPKALCTRFLQRPTARGVLLLARSTEASASLSAQPSLAASYIASSPQARPKRDRMVRREFLSLRQKDAKVEFRTQNGSEHLPKVE